MYQQGISLIQLLLTLLLIAIGTQLASPVYSTLIENHRRQLAAQQLANTLRNARTEALLRHHSIVVYALPGGWSKGWRVIIDKDGKDYTNPNNPILLERRVNTRIPIAGNTPVKRYVRFSPLGEPLLTGGAFQAGTLHVCQSTASISHYQIVLAKTGRISLRHEPAAQALCAASEQGPDP